MAGYQEIEYGESLVELGRRAAQIEIFAVELSAAAAVPDLHSAVDSLANLRSEVALAETVIAVSMATPEFLGATDAFAVDANGKERRRAVAPADPPVRKNPEDICAQALADRLVAILVQLERLRRAAPPASESTSLVYGLVELADVLRNICSRIGHINEVWLWNRRHRPASALAHAVRSLAFLGSHSGVRRVLAELRSRGSEPMRAACSQLIELLTLEPAARR